MPEYYNQPAEAETESLPAPPLCAVSAPACPAAERPIIEDLGSPLQIGRLRLRNRVFAAPMSGISDLPFRRLAWAGGAGLVFSEMAASNIMAAAGASASGRRLSLQRLRGEEGAPYAAQLIGREPLAMAEAAKIAEAEGAVMIDINMGCPARKLAGKTGAEAACGAALMRDENLAARVVEAVAAAVNLPISVKMRLGWDETSLNAPRLARAAQAAGAQMISVHARTRSQFYAGRADWAAVRAVREQISVPLLINGDIESRADAEQAMRLSGADGVMIGRAACGRPWLIGQIAGYAPPLTEKIPDYIVAHYRAQLEYYGLMRGLRHARKHLDWYLQKQAAGLWTVAERTAIITAREADFVEARLREIFARRQW